MAARSLGVSSLTLGAAVCLGLSKPTTSSFASFFRDWLAEHLARVEEPATSVTTSPSSPWNSFVAYVSEQLQDLSVAACANLSPTEFTDAGICLVACVSAVGTQPDTKLYFIGVAGQWYFVPKDIMENGKWYAAHVGISLAIISVARTALSLGRRLTRSNR